MQETQVIGLDPWVRKIFWSRKRQPTTIFLSAVFQGQRSLVGYGTWDRKGLDTAEHARTF